MHTGDAGYVDDEGYLFIKDRIKDMICSGGENIYPHDVENVLAAHPAIADIAVIGVPDERWGEQVHAVVVLHAGHELDEADLAVFCDGRLADFKRPRSISFAADLPRNAAGKLLKTELRKTYSAGAGRTGEARICLPPDRTGREQRALHEIGIAVEALGYDCIAFYDHVAGAEHAEREPPLTGPYTERDPFHDPLVALTRRTSPR